jgi:hypothetical protein
MPYKDWYCVLISKQRVGAPTPGTDSKSMTCAKQGKFIGMTKIKERLRPEINFFCIIYSSNFIEFI